MASFGDNIMRLFKKTAKGDEQQNAAAEPDGAPEAETQPEQALQPLQPGQPIRQSEIAEEPTKAADENKWQRQAVDERHVSDTAASESSVYLSHWSSLSAPLSSPLSSPLSPPLSPPFSSPLSPPASSPLPASQPPANAMSNHSIPTEESFRQAASCATTSPSTLAWLATQQSTDIRASVAANIHTPQDALRRLAVDADQSVRLAVASNKRTGDDVLKALTHDDSKKVSTEAHIALGAREKSSTQTNMSGFNKFSPPKANPVQTKVPIIGATKSPTGVNLPKYTPPQSLHQDGATAAPAAQPSAAPTPAIPPRVVAPPITPRQTTSSHALPQPQPNFLSSQKAGNQPVSPLMPTPRSLPRASSPPPSGLPPAPPQPATPVEKAPVAPVAKTTPLVKPAFEDELPPKVVNPAAAQAKASQTFSAAPPVVTEADGHNLLNNHKFKTTSNHLIASYTDLDAVSIEVDTRSPGAWLSLNSEGAINAYKKQKDTVKDVKMNLGAHGADGPKRPSSVVNITPNATPSETIAFLKIVAGRISTPPGRLLELAVHANEEIRAAVAENANLPSDAFTLLAKDMISTVKLRLIDNSNCPMEALKLLQKDADPYVAFEARNACRRLEAGLAKEREHNQHRHPGHQV